jgi:hypothetical protein
MKTRGWREREQKKASFWHEISVWFRSTKVKAQRLKETKRGKLSGAHIAYGCIIADHEALRFDPEASGLNDKRCSLGMQLRLRGAQEGEEERHERGRPVHWEILTRFYARYSARVGSVGGGWVVW